MEPVEPQHSPVARLHLRSTVEGVDHRAIETWCIGEGGEGWVGMGWGMWKDELATGTSWERYLRDHGDTDESVRRLHDLPIGSLVWTRKKDGSYWLGELTGSWEYRDGDEAQALDMFNVRPCSWRRIGLEDAVPGKIVNNFKVRKTLNPVKDPGAVRYSRLLATQKGSLDQAGVKSASPSEVIGSLLGANDLEDLIAVYLQDRHDLVLVSRRRGTVGYEYVLRDRGTGRRSVVSVKSGESAVDLDALPVDPEVDVWAFAVRDRRSIGNPRDDVRWITNEQLEEFLAQRRSILPDQVERWLG